MPYSSFRIKIALRKKKNYKRMFLLTHILSILRVLGLGNMILFIVDLGKRKGAMGEIN